MAEIRLILVKTACTYYLSNDVILKDMGHINVNFLYYLVVSLCSVCEGVEIQQTIPVSLDLWQPIKLFSYGTKFLHPLVFPCVKYSCLCVRCGHTRTS